MTKAFLNLTRTPDSVKQKFMRIFFQVEIQIFGA